MTYLQGIFLGILQGIAEFLPISSSGHLLVGRNWMGLGDIPVLFDILLHVATLLVIFFVFREKIGQLLVSFFRFIVRKNDDSDKTNLKFIALILIATAATGALGFFLNELEMESHLRWVFFLFFITGLILIIPRFISGNKDYEKIGIKEAIIVGLAQGIGVLPGISRSGITISAGLLCGMSRSVAGEFSFIISLPAVIGALILDLKDAGELFSSVDPLVMIASFAAAVMAGYFSLIFLMKLVRKGNLYFFSFYLIPLAVIGWFFL